MKSSDNKLIPFSDVIDKMRQYYWSGDHANVLLADQLLLQYIDVRDLIPARPLCNKVYGSKKRQNIVFEFMRLAEAAGYGFSADSFILARAFFDQHYLFVDKSGELTAPYDTPGYTEYYNVSRGTLERLVYLSENRKEKGGEGE